MAIQEFDQTTVFNNPDLPSGASLLKQFNTVELLGEGEIEGQQQRQKLVLQIKHLLHISTHLRRIFFLTVHKFYKRLQAIQHHKTVILILRMLALILELAHQAKHLLTVSQI